MILKETFEKTVSRTRVDQIHCSYCGKLLGVGVQYVTGENAKHFGIKRYFQIKHIMKFADHKTSYKSEACQECMPKVMKEFAELKTHLAIDNWIKTSVESAWLPDVPEAIEGFTEKPVEPIRYDSGM